MSEERTLEELLAAGEVEAALILRGDYTPAERELAQQVWKQGLEQGKRLGAARVVELQEALRSEIRRRVLNSYRYAHEGEAYIDELVAAALASGDGTEGAAA